MNVRYLMGALHSFSIKNILGLRVIFMSRYESNINLIWVNVNGKTHRHIRDSKNLRLSENWKINFESCIFPKHWNTGLVSSGASVTSRGEGASLALVGDLSSVAVTIKMPYAVDVLHQPASHPNFSYWVG